MRTGAQIDETAESDRARSLYDQDFAAWVAQQVELLRAGRTSGLDATI